MVDFPKIRKKAPYVPVPAGMPPAPDRAMPVPPGMPVPPAPSPDIDLPAPAAPRKPEVKEEPAPPAAAAPEAKARDVAEPLKLPETGGKPRGEARDIHGSPPVFIKIDKYTDIVKNLQKLKSYSLSLRDAMDALSDIEKEMTTGISIANKALDDFNTIIAILDSKLLRASAIEDFDIDAPGDVDKYVKGIYEQMEKIKTELKEMT